MSGMRPLLSLLSLLLLLLMMMIEGCVERCAPQWKLLLVRCEVKWTWEGLSSAEACESGGLQVGTSARTRAQLVPICMNLVSHMLPDVVRVRQSGDW